MNKRNLIGLLTNDLVGSYQYSFWAGMNAAARVETCDLVSFNGGEVGSNNPLKSMRTSAFELVQHAKPDALVLLAPVLANSNGNTSLEAFVDSLGPIPLVTVGFTIPGHPAVMVDNVAGMGLLIDHLVGDHGRRRVAYVGGPTLNPEARLRREAFLRGLTRQRLEFDPALEVEANFDFGVARDRVRALLDSGAKFDALVAANDNMALGAMEALKERGLRIPDDVLVGGFDDVEDGRYSTPALTSIHQPVFEQGEICLRLALDLVDGLRVAPVTNQSASLVRRGSCGCKSVCLEESTIGKAEARPGSGTEKSLGRTAHRQAVRGACDPHAAGNISSGSLDSLVAAMTGDVKQTDAEATLGAFLFLLETNSHPDDDPDRWQIFLSRLRSASLPYIPPSPLVMAAFEGLLHQLRVVVHERCVQASGYKSLQMQRWARTLHETGCRLINSFELTDLVETLAQELWGLQISSFHLLMREPDAGGEEMRLMLSVDSGVREAVPAGGEQVEPGVLFQRIIRRSPLRKAFMIEPLFFGTTQLGFILLELASRRGMLLDSLRGQISASIMGSRFALAHRSRKPEAPDPEILIGW